MYIPVMECTNPGDYGVKEFHKGPVEIFFPILVSAFCLALPLSALLGQIEFASIWQFVVVIAACLLFFTSLLVLERLIYAYKLHQSLKGERRHIPLTKFSKLVRDRSRGKIIVLAYGMDDDFGEWVEENERVGEIHQSGFYHSKRRAFLYPIQVGKNFSTRYGLRLEVTEVRRCGFQEKTHWIVVNLHGLSLRGFIRLALIP